MKAQPTCPKCTARAELHRRRWGQDANELRLRALLAARDLTLRRDEGGLFDVLDGRALVVDGATFDQLERWFALDEWA